MDFEWGESKRGSNIVKHGYDFLEAYRLFDRRHLFEPAAKMAGEERWLVVSEMNGKHVAVVFTLREMRIRIISMRRARNGEKRRYQALLG